MNGEKKAELGMQMILAGDWEGTNKEKRKKERTKGKEYIFISVLDIESASFMLSNIHAENAIF